MIELLSSRKDTQEFRRRYLVLIVLGFVAFVVLWVRVFQLQVLDYTQYSAAAQDNITRRISLPATRGLLFDSHGRVLATNRPSFNVYVTPQLLEIPYDTARIAEWMELSPEARSALETKLSHVPAHRALSQMELFTDISREQLATLETHANEMPGLHVIAVPWRIYPYKALAAHAIGYLNEVNADDLKRLKEHDYRAGDEMGRSGIERAWESYLRGRRGYRRIFVDARGALQDKGDPGFVHAQPLEQAPVAGRDLTLTLDMDLMEIVERSFRNHPSGAVVAVDVHSGAVRALFSKPAYDSNEMSGRLTVERYNTLKSNSYRPLIDKTLYESYFPGSTFKPISALAGLETGVLNLSTHVDCKGHYEVGNRKFRCIQSHGDMNIEQALVQSCNVYFYKLGEQVGLDRLATYAKEFGFGSKTGIGIHTESGGFIPTRAWYTKTYGEKFRVGFALNAAIGQGNTRATLLQLAMAYAALANGGTLYVPKLVEKISAPDGTVLETFAPRIRKMIQLQPKHLAVIQSGLIGVVNDKKGTAYEARGESTIRIAGKTGTAQVTYPQAEPSTSSKKPATDTRDHAWFAGFGPAHAPELAIVVLVEHGGVGGKQAAPIAVRIMNEYLGRRTTP